MKPAVCLVQPPFVQLNGPYPSTFYLRSFLEKRGYAVTVRDHSIGLFERMFCRAGIRRIFSDAKAAWKKAPRKKRTISRIVDRFFREEALWRRSIESLTDFLRGKNREYGHLLALANGTVPWGPRYGACLDALDRRPGPEDAPLLAAKLLEDLADFITCTLDSNFSLIRYSPAAASGFREFSPVRDAARGYVLETFYRPFLQDEWDQVEGLFPGAPREKMLLGLSVPFPGCLAGALSCAASARERFGPGLSVAAGGGYVSTELRFAREPSLYRYFDALVFDRGYAALLTLLQKMETPELGAGIENLSVDEDEEAARVFPDYRGVDFSRYLYMADGTNPMHRLWSDGHWLKAYLAYGCYWHNCSFCDVTLDYIRRFLPVKPGDLFRHLQKQAAATGVWGVHLVDEAAPPASLREFARLNRESERHLCFWGNIRFERAFTRELCALLAAGGLIGVSGGLEVATEEGFARLGKGAGLAEALRACAAFKEAGILTHAYLIFGCWDEDEQEIIDSAEIVRQIFSLGLLDSAFWHKFILTRHSRIYAEWKQGKHPGLKVKDDVPASGIPEAGGPERRIFALNDLSFEGEEAFDKYTEPLDNLLAAWMAGNTGFPVRDAFPFRVKKPRIPSDYASSLLEMFSY